MSATRFSAATCALLLQWGFTQYRPNCAAYWPPLPSTTTTTTAIPTTTTTTTTTPIITTTAVTTTTIPITTTVATTSTTTSSTISYSPLPSSVTVGSTILIIARNDEDVKGATGGLLGYGIPWQTLVVPQGGTVLPALTTDSNANFGGIIVVGQVAYDYGATGFQSALTPAQWQQLYSYQVSYGVRMVQWDVYPAASYGATPLGGCCGTGVEQLFSFSDTRAFSQAGLKSGATISTQGLYHYPATISNSSIATEFARFDAAAGFPASTAGVINNFADGRQQMVFFISFAWWSFSSLYMQHAWINYVTRGLYAGYRRVNLNTQIDDVFLETPMYRPVGAVYRVTPADFTSIKAWIPRIQARMNPGSIYFPELAHNGNGNIQAAVNAGYGAYCSIGPVYTDERADTALEYKKPLGSGTDAWPVGIPANYPYSSLCLSGDPLRRWFAVASNRDSFMHLSHTFTHYELNNATYADAIREIQWNQAWIQMSGIAAGKFSRDALVPPAITGLHNGDVLRAWKDAGLTNAVGDNTRPVLRNPNNPMHPYITNFASDGYDGFEIVPRWATRIYYNCDTPACNFQEWVDVSQGTGNFANLLKIDVADATRHLFGLYHDGFMFHQANLRTAGLPNNLSLYQQWIEAVVTEFTRLVNWPLITLGQTDLSNTFTDRAARDRCNYKLTWTQTQQNGASSSRPVSITGFTVTSDGNTCGAEIPITVPAAVANLQGMRSERVGNDPQTIWVRLTGQPVVYRFATPVSF